MASAAISSSLVLTKKPLSSSSSSVAGFSAEQRSIPATWRIQKKARPSVAVRASYRDRSGGNSAGIFVGGFVLGGIIVGALGCVYAPQISKALTGPERKDLMRKLPKFIYDEEKALEKTRQVLADKIAQLNSAIDDVSSQLRSEDSAATVDEQTASVS